MTPSNANTSGLEVVAWRYTLINERGDVLFSGVMLDGPPREGPCGVDTWRVEPLVTAASAQARIADLEARVEYQRGSRDGHAAHAHSEFEARVAAEARADRLAKALERIERSKSQTYGHLQSVARAALQQETQK